MFQAVTSYLHTSMDPYLMIDISFFLVVPLCQSVHLGVVIAMLVDLCKIDAVASGDCEWTAP